MGEMELRGEKMNLREEEMMSHPEMISLDVTLGLFCLIKHKALTRKKLQRGRNAVVYLQTPRKKKVEVSFFFFLESLHQRNLPFPFPIPVCVLIFY